MYIIEDSDDYYDPDQLRDEIIEIYEYIHYRRSFGIIRIESVSIDVYEVMTVMHNMDTQFGKSKSNPNSKYSKYHFEISEIIRLYRIQQHEKLIQEV